jgi:hypothetical protein
MEKPGFFQKYAVKRQASALQTITVLKRGEVCLYALCPMPGLRASRTSYES